MSDNTSEQQGGPLWHGLMSTFGGWRFPAFMITALLSLMLLLVAVILVPPAETGLGAFAEEFRVWCLGYNAETGEFESIYLVAMIGNPVMLCGILLLVWWQPLREVMQTRPSALITPILLALLLVGGVVGGLFQFQRDKAAAGEPVFPGKSLRTTFPAPEIKLTDHRGKPFRLTDYRGRVVLITAVYSTCGLTCPRIMAQTEEVLSKLPPKMSKQLTVAGITLDPERDDPHALTAMAKARGLSSPPYLFLTGKPPAVNRTLDQYGFTRRRDPKTGMIDHANLFLLVDRGGRVAYRFTLGELQTKWLLAGLKELLDERQPPEPTR